MTRTNLATDPRGTGSADLVLAGFDEAAGDPLAGIETSRRFTRIGTRVRTNLARNPGARTATGDAGWSTNNPAYWPRGFYDVPAPHPLGLTRAVKQYNNGSNANAYALSLYNIGADGGAGTPDRYVSAWLYTDTPGLAAAPSGGALSWSVPLTPGVWQFVAVPTATLAGKYSGFGVRRLDGLPATPDQIVYATGALVETIPGGDYFDGTFPDTPPTDEAAGVEHAWTGPADASTSTQTTATLAQPPAGTDPITNLARLLTANYGTSTGAVERTVTDDVARFTYTTQGNTAWSDALVVRPAQAANTAPDRTPVKAGTVARMRIEFRGERYRALRWRVQWFDAAGATLGSRINQGYVVPTDSEWTVAEWEQTAPAGAAAATFDVNSGGGTAEPPSGFILGDYLEFRAAVITLDDPMPPSYFDGDTPDTAPTDTALGWDYAWTGTPDASPSTATPILQSVIGLPYPLPANSDGLFRIRARASAPMPGGRIVVRPDLLNPAGELAVLIGVDLPEGESSVDLPLGTGANPTAGIAFVWGAATGGPPGTSVELTRVLVEVPETPPDPPGDGYFDGWTLDVPPSELTDGVAYTWTGTPDASTSTATTVSRTRRQIREDIAAALSTVPGITGTPTAPRTLGRGQGWPVWQARTPLTIVDGDEFRWLVHVTLPAGMPDATVLESDELTAYVIAALSSVGVIERIEPDALIAVQDKASQPVPALTVTITTTN